MKKYILILISFITLNYIHAQESKIIQVANNDSVILQVGNNSNIQWQKSSNSTNWNDISGENKPIFRFKPAESGYYRAQISGLSCGTVFSDTVFVPVLTKYIETISSSQLQYLYNVCFMPLRMWYGKEMGIAFSEYGTDIFSLGNGASSITYLMDFGTYMFSSNSTYSYIGGFWNEFYKGVTNCNAFIDQLGRSSILTEDKIRYEAEIRFLKAVYQWHIVEIWGGTLNLTGHEPIQQTEKSIAPVDTFYNQIIRDLNYAVSNLPVNSASNTDISKFVALAFLARVHLTKGNNNEALQCVMQVINSGKYALRPNFSSVWDINNRQNSEVIYAIDYTPNPDPFYTYSSLYPGNNPGLFNTSTGGNNSHLFWTMNYSILPGLLRSVEYGRPFNRLIPTRYFLDLFNDTLDQRYKGSFQFSWNCNNSANVLKWPSTIYINGVATNVDAAKVNTPLFALGDTALLITKNYPVASKAYLSSTPTAGQAIHPTRGYLILDYNDLFNADGSSTSYSNKRYSFAFVRKFSDNTRLTPNEMFSTRNFYALRLAEIYLIAAEASLKTGFTNSAYIYLQQLANARAIDGNGTKLLSQYGINNGSDLSIDFILDERARELAGEQLRWFDLKRTGKLVERVKANNPDARYYIQGFHNLRPIPLEFIHLEYQSIIIQNEGY